MTARELFQIVAPVAPDTRVSSVLEIFSSDRDRIAVPVVAGMRPVGLVNRKTLIEYFAKPFSRELSGNKPISAFMDNNPIVVDIDTDLDDLSRRIVDAGMQYMYDGFVITDKGAYAGMGTGHDLMKVLTERKQAHLYRLAHYDALTDLPNRLLFADRLSRALMQARRTGESFALLYLDIDRFKAVNDTFGHEAGDSLLKSVAHRFGRLIRESDTVARMGGDEFTLILMNAGVPREIARVAETILESFKEPFVVSGHEVSVSASIGIALFPDEDGMSDAGAMLRKADTAMYRVKASGKNGYRFFSAEMTVATLQRLVLENDLRKAMDNGEFVVHYQPRVNCLTGGPTGMEALVRWRRGGGTLVSPAEFIPLAEETGLIVPIGEWVLRTACAQTKEWLDRGLPPLRVSVNISARQFRDPGLIAMIERTLAETGLQAGYLELELTEGLAMENVKETIATLRVLDDMGVAIAIDDFGTGYSSLSYLKRLPLRYLKIDQSFIREVTTDADDAAIAKMIIEMGRTLQLSVVAEGVETSGQLDFLRRLGCHEAQGYLFSKPVSAAEFAAMFVNGPYAMLPAGGAVA